MNEQTNMPHVRVAAEAKGDLGSPCSPLWVLETKLGHSRKAPSALSHWIGELLKQWVETPRVTELNGGVATKYVNSKGFWRHNNQTQTNVEWTRCCWCNFTAALPLNTQCVCTGTPSHHHNMDERHLEHPGSDLSLFCAMTCSVFIRHARFSIVTET